MILIARWLSRVLTCTKYRSLSISTIQPGQIYVLGLPKWSKPYTELFPVPTLILATRSTLIDQIWRCSLQAIGLCQSEFRYVISICAFDGNHAKMVEQKSSLLVHYGHLHMIPSMLFLSSWTPCIMAGNGTCGILSLWARKRREMLSICSFYPQG